MQAANDLHKEGIVQETKEKAASDTTKRDRSRKAIFPHTTLFMISLEKSFVTLAHVAKRAQPQGLRVLWCGRGTRQDSMTAVILGCAGDRLKFYLNTHFVEAELLWKMKYTWGWVSLQLENPSNNSFRLQVTNWKLWVSNSTCLVAN